MAQAGDEGLDARVAERGTVAHALATPGAAAQPRHVGLGAALVDEDQPVRLLAHARLALGMPVLASLTHVGAPLFAGLQRFF